MMPYLLSGTDCKQIKLASSLEPAELVETKKKKLAIADSRRQAPPLTLQSFLLPFSPSGAGRYKYKTAEHPLVEIPDRHRVPGARAVRLHLGRKHRLWRQHPHCEHWGGRGSSSSGQHSQLHRKPATGNRCDVSAMLSSQSWQSRE